MARTIRLCPGGYVYHVLNRASGRATVFRNAGDYIAFENILGEGLGRMPMRLLGYCLMPNHWHLLLQPYHNGDLSVFMKWITMTHVQRYHAAHETVGQGHLYQGRFKSFPVQGASYYYTILRYIEGNPLRAGMVRSSTEWRWSSLSLRSGASKGDLTLSAGLMELPPNWSRLLDTIAREKDMARLTHSVEHGVPFGESEWAKQTSMAMGLTFGTRPRGRPVKDEINGV
jgi:putative transposase